MMTVSAIMAGLLPILWSSGTGSGVMQRIAVPMVGGMVSSTILTLLVIPAIYAIVKGWRMSRRTEAAPAAGKAARDEPRRVRQEATFMMDQMSGMMMWGMGLVWVLLVIVLVLAAAALVKYLISK
jgi:predicted RND superfamily exporter protein